MIYSLLVLSSPLQSQNAVRFAAALVQRGHQLERVFFMDDGVYHGQGSAVYPQDEADAGQAWQALHADHGVELVLCSASAAKRGILDAGEAARHERQGATMHPAFSVGGLGLLVEATINADRLVTFGH